MKKRMILLFLCVLLVVSQSGCSLMTDSAISYIDAETDISELSDATIDTIVENIVNGMSLDEQIGQMFMVDLKTFDLSKKSIKKGTLSNKIKKNLELYPVGGIVLYGSDAKSKSQMKKLTSALQKQSNLPLFLAVSEEGGTMSSLSSKKKMGLSTYPSAQELGAMQNTDQVRKNGETMAAELLDLGINLDLAPVCDLAASTEPESSAVAELGSRLYGSDAKTVAKVVKAQVKGMVSQGIGVTLKHFPGQGSASSDTRISAANLTRSIEQLRSEDFLPFQSGIKAGAQVVMMSQTASSLVTGDTKPACMSKVWVNSVLREELGFDGVVMTNTMNMRTITTQYTSKEVAVNCVNAGVDMILSPDDLEEAYDGLLDAVKKGMVKKERIQAAVRRIIRLKLKLGILPLDSQIVIKASQNSYEKIGEQEKQGK